MRGCVFSFDRIALQPHPLAAFLQTPHRMKVSAKDTLTLKLTKYSSFNCQSIINSDVPTWFLEICVIYIAIMDLTFSGQIKELNRD